MDVDARMDYWIKGIPYVWIPNKKNVNACQRYYLLSNDTALFAFDHQGNSFSINRKAIKRETSPGTTFSPFRFDFGEKNNVRNYFLAWTKPISKIKHEIRIEGKPTTVHKRVSVVRAKIILKNVVYKNIEILKHTDKYPVMLIELDESN